MKPPPVVDIDALLTRSQIQYHLHNLSLQESSLDATLSTLINSRSKLTTQLNALDGLRELVEGIQGEAEHMAREVRAVAETAERVGGKVRVLDEEQVGLLPFMCFQAAAE